MKKKKYLSKNKLYFTIPIFSAFLCFIFLFAGCGQNNADELSLGEANENPADTMEDNAGIETEEGPEQEEMKEEPSGLPVIQERAVQNGRIQSYLTGEWTDLEKAERRPIAVMIPNNAPIQCIVLKKFRISIACCCLECCRSCSSFWAQKKAHGLQFTVPCAFTLFY